MMRYLTFCTACLLLAACSDPDSSPETELREWVARGEVAAEAKDRGQLLDMISADYADGRGNDHEHIGDLLRAWFFRQSSIALLVDIDEIIVSGDTAALIRLSVGMAGTNNDAFGIRADAYDFEFELQKPDEDWLLIGARWGDLGGELH